MSRSRVVACVLLGGLACARSASEPGTAECRHYAELAVCASSLPNAEDATDTIEEGCYDKLDESEARGEACHEEYLAALECLAMLDCGAFERWMVRDAVSPCHGTWASVAQACGDLPLEPHLGVPGSN